LSEKKINKNLNDLLEDKRIYSSKMLLDILETPINFIKENLTGWVLLILVIFIIYFVCLRNYYTQKERFYNQVQFKKNNILETKKNKQTDKKEIEKKENSIIEGFVEQQQLSEPQNIISSYASTTLFDNLNLSTTQLQSVKIKYNDIIAQYIIDLGELIQQQKKNRFLNIQKQFDLILAKGIDKLINYLNDTIKSYNKITRTSIRTEVINTLTVILELLINKINNDIANQTQKLAILDSTTINYNTQLNELTTFRMQLEEYFEINKLINNYSHKPRTSDKEINAILDKSFILPIYEQNYNKIQQLINSDFNGNENTLADKYSKAYMDFLEQKKKEELNINPLILASQIESGLVSLITGNSKKYTQEQYNNMDSGNPIPEQEKKLISNTYMNSSNIIKDPGNRGAYLIDKSTQNSILEGFEDNSTNNNNIKQSNIIKAINNNVNLNKNNSSNGENLDNNIISNLISGNFVQYIMNFINEKLNWFLEYYNTRMGISNSNNSNYFKFNLEENMIPAGFLLFVLSMLVYFIDITS
jgi:hypothetical protein